MLLQLLEHPANNNLADGIIQTRSPWDTLGKPAIATQVTSAVPAEEKATGVYILSLDLKENIDFGFSRCFRFTYCSLQQPPALVILFHRGGVVLLTPANQVWFQESDYERVGACGQRSSEKTPGKQAQETRLSTHY